MKCTIWRSILYSVADEFGLHDVGVDNFAACVSAQHQHELSQVLFDQLALHSMQNGVKASGFKSIRVCRTDVPC